MTTIEQSVPPAEPPRVLGTFSASCVVIGAIIGVGIFFAPSNVAKLTHTGGLALTAWAIGGAIALCGALTFGALGARYHAHGAQYQILRDAYGRLPAFLFVFCNATAVQAGAIGVIAVVCAQNLAAAAGFDGEPLGRARLLTMAGVLIAGVSVANIVGVRWGAAIQNLTVLSKVLTLLAVTALAVFWAPDGAAGAPGAMGSAALEPVTLTSAAATTAVMAALVPAFFAYGGWQHALWISGEIREPRRTLPRAIVGGVVLVVIVYLLVNWAYLRLLGADGVAQSGALAADATAVVLPGVGRRLIAGAVAISAFGVLNAQLLSGPRLVYGMARDGQFFPPFARLGGRTRTPVAAILLLAIMAAVLLAADSAYEWATEAEKSPIDRLVNGVVFIDSIFFGLTGAAFFLLRRRNGDGDATAMRVAGYPLVPALFVLGELALVAGSFVDPETRIAALAGAGWIALAGVLYLVRFRGRET